MLKINRNRGRTRFPVKLIVVLFVVVAGFLLGSFLQPEDYSKLSWNKDAKDSEISVIADDGTFAADVKMSVDKIDDSEIIKSARRAAGQGDQDVFAYNITFTDKDGKETQPNARVKVTINPKDYELKASRYALVHIDDNQNAKYLGNIAKSSTGNLSFYANSFSIYAIIPTRETDQQRYARYTYNYYVDDEIAYSQIVRNGDILNAPAAPSKEDLIFMGWYTENNKVFNDLNLPVSIPDSLQTDKTINLHARFANEIYSLIFYNPQGNVLATKTGTTNDVVNTNEYRYEVSAGYYVDAWTTDASVMDYYDVNVCDHQCNVPDNITIPNSVTGNYTIGNESIKLYPIVRSVKWVHYHANDNDADAHTPASFTPSGYAFYGRPATAPPNPTRTGYTFAGWTTDQAGNNLYDFNTPLTGDIDLYAKWTPKTNTQYRIVFWKEALVDGRYVEGNYEYASHVDSTGTSGTTVGVTQTMINNALRASNLEHYEFDWAEEDAVIHGDGSTVINAYFKLTKYKVNFVIETTTGTGGNTRYCMNYYNNRNTLTTTCQNTSFTQDANLDIYYTNGSPHDLKSGYSFEARMGELISTSYPGVGQVQIDYTGNNSTIGAMIPYAWRAVNNNPNSTIRISKPITMTEELISTSTQNPEVTLYLITTVADTHVVDINYWFEKPDGSGYERSEDYSFTANSNANSFQGRTVTGYELLSTTPRGYSSSSGNTFHFYYNRNKYSLNFYNYNTAGESYSNIRHGASLTSYNYIPTRPSGVEEAFTFQGWYTTPECISGTEFDLTTQTMPMSNLMLYAKWENTTYVTLSFNSNGGNAIDPQPVLYGHTARSVESPTRTGYTFIGWRKTDGTFFNFDNIITEDTQLVASWIPFDTIYIDYDANDPTGSATVIDDTETYVDTSTTAILPAPTDAPEGMYFVGWNVNGRIYYPGNVVMILLSDIPDGSDRITIRAEWGRDVDKTSITYNPGTGMGSEASFELEQNEAFTVKTASELNYTKTGYTFVDWNSEPDGSGVTYKANTQWAADQRATLPNMLYAQWEINCHTLTVRHIYENGSQYDETETSEVCYDVHYETHASTRDNNYIGTVTSGVAEGNMPDNDMEVVYTYSLREALITVLHVDVNDNPLANPDELPYHFGDTYTANPSPLLTPNYNYTVDPVGGETGTVNGDKTIKFIYTKKQATITTVHIGPDGNTIHTDTQTVDYGDTYHTQPLSSMTESHNYTVNPTNGETGIVSGDKTITYTYTKKTFTITVNHVIEDATNTTETQTVEYGDTCSVSPRSELLTEYDYVQSGDDCNGAVTGNLEVTFTYTRKRFDLTVRHLKEDNTSIKENVTHDHKYGDSYNNITADPEVLLSYTCTTNDPLSGTFTSDVTITFICSTRKYTLTVHHIKDDGTPFAADTVTPYEYGQSYTADPIENDYYTYELTSGSATGNITGNVEVTYTYTRKIATIIVHHVDKDDHTITLANDDRFTKPYGETYETTASTSIPGNYEFASRTSNHTGTAETTPIEVTYYYQKKDPDLQTTIKIIDGNDTLTRDSQLSEYDISYTANIGGYMGPATIVIVNKLPYPVDEENSDFAGGTYDPETNTITWTENREVTEVPQTIVIKKSLSVIFKDIDSHDRVAVNRASATITLESGKERVATGDTNINIHYTSKAIVHYYLKDTTKSIKTDKTYTGLVGDEFTVKEETIKGYKIVSNEPAKTYRFADETIEIVFEYTAIEPTPQPTPTPEPKPEPTPNPVTDDSNLALLFTIGLGTAAGLGAIFFMNAIRRNH